MCHAYARMECLQRTKCIGSKRRCNKEKSETFMKAVRCRPCRTCSWHADSCRGFSHASPLSLFKTAAATLQRSPDRKAVGRFAWQPPRAETGTVKPNLSSSFRATSSRSHVKSRVRVTTQRLPPKRNPSLSMCTLPSSNSFSCCKVHLFFEIIDYATTHTTRKRAYSRWQETNAELS